MNNQEKNTYVRSQILRALLELMSERPFEEISVSALTERAGVGRASFYRNYQSKEDVLRQESERLMGEWKQTWEQMEPAAPNEFFISLLNFYQKHSAFYLSLYRAGLSQIILDGFLQGVQITPEEPNAAAYLKSAMAYMAYGWVTEWIHRGMPESGTELAEMIRAAQNREGDN